MQRGFYFDQTRCIGCFICCVACKDWHDIPAGPAHWLKVIPFEEGEFPQPFFYGSYYFIKSLYLPPFVPDTLNREIALGTE